MDWTEGSEEETESDMNVAEDLGEHYEYLVTSDHPFQELANESLSLIIFSHI